MRVLMFDLIEDGRFGGSKRALMEKDKMLKRAVNVVHEGNIRTLHFSGEKELPPAPSLQWRKRYWVARREGETWDDVMGNVNSVQAPFYKFEHIGLPAEAIRPERELLVVLGSDRAVRRDDGIHNGVLMQGDVYHTRSGILNTFKLRILLSHGYFR